MFKKNASNPNSTSVVNLFLIFFFTFFRPNQGSKNDFYIEIFKIFFLLFGCLRFIINLQNFEEQTF